MDTICLRPATYLSMDTIFAQMPAQMSSVLVGAPKFPNAGLVRGASPRTTQSARLYTRYPLLQAPSLCYCRSFAPFSAAHG